MKKAIALFITMMFLVVIVAIISKMMNKYEKFLSIDNKYIAQNNIIIQDTINVLKNLTKDMNSYNDIKNIFTSFALNEKDFKVLYTITPFSKVNINKKNIDFYLDNIFDYYHINDPLFLENLIYDTIDKDTKERDIESEIILYNHFFQNGGIYNYRHLKMILDYYYKKTDDKAVYKIPWRKLFEFRGDVIVCQAMDKNVKKFLNLEDLECDSNNTNKILREFDIISYDKNISFLINVNVKYNQENINIIYDINKKKVVSIENNPIY